MVDDTKPKAHRFGYNSMFNVREKSLSIERYTNPNLIETTWKHERYHTVRPNK